MAGGCGHGCGHNMLGAGAMAAAFGIKKYLEKKGEGHGTVIFFGCPGEEGGASKAFMARDGVWKDLDAALTWHPSDVNQVTSGTCNSCIQTEYIFKGVASHASGAPEFGRSALDAVEVMNMGVQFLREHMPDSARIHYAITDAAAAIPPTWSSPTPECSTWCAPSWPRTALALQARVDKIAQAAAMMTETEVRQQFIDGCSNTVPNRVLEQLLWDNFDQVGVDTYTPEEMEYAKKIMDSYEMKSDRLPGAACDEDEAIAAFVDEKSPARHQAHERFPHPLPLQRPAESRLHGCGRRQLADSHSPDQRGLLCVQGPRPQLAERVLRPHLHRSQERDHRRRKVLAATAMDLYEKPEILKAAREEFEKKTAGGYYCPVPADAVPVVPGQ